MNNLLEITLVYRYVTVGLYYFIIIIFIEMYFLWMHFPD